MTERAELVDTAGLAEHLGCSPRHVRRLARKGLIPSLGRMRGRRGRPGRWFDVAAVDAALGRVALDITASDVLY